MCNGTAHTKIAPAHHLGHFGMRTVERWHSTSLPISDRSRWNPDVVLGGNGVSPTVFKSAASAATQASATAQSRTALVTSNRRLDVQQTDQGGNAPSGMSAHRVHKVAKPAAPDAAKDKGSNTAAGAAQRQLSKAEQKAVKSAASKAQDEQDDAERFMRQPHVRPAGMCSFYKERCVSALTP